MTQSLQKKAPVERRYPVTSSQNQANQPSVGVLARGIPSPLTLGAIVYSSEE